MSSPLDSIEQPISAASGIRPRRVADIPPLELASNETDEPPPLELAANEEQPSDKAKTATSGRLDLDEIYHRYGKAYGVDPNLLIEQGRQETINFNPKVLSGDLDSPKAARGAGQF